MVGAAFVVADGLEPPVNLLGFIQYSTVSHWYTESAKTFSRSHNAPWKGPIFHSLETPKNLQTLSLSANLVGELTEEVDLHGESIHDRLHACIGESLLYFGVRREPHNRLKEIVEQDFVVRLLGLLDRLALDGSGQHGGLGLSLNWSSTTAKLLFISTGKIIICLHQLIGTQKSASLQLPTAHF